ncbi:MAG: hypothetical protein IPK82_12305 [Polyangiaceae bacterium]|nr:hypothetical protein [Polyangiaceae bacterium]
MRRIGWCLGGLLLMSGIACGDAGSSTSSTGVTGGAGGNSGGSGGNAGQAGSTTASSGGSTSTGETGGGGNTGGAGGGGTGGSGGVATGGGGTGGTGGTMVTWPTCQSQPDNVPLATINSIWLENPTMAKEYWVPGVYITGVSGGGCVAGVGCQLFVQQKETFASIADGSKQALRVNVFPVASEYFVNLNVGDQINLQAYAYRHTQNGQNELFFHVSSALPGCAMKVGSGAPAPVSGLVLADLTVPLYEDVMGPLFIRLDTVSGKTKLPDQTFALWESFMPGMQPIEEVTSLSPFFLTGSAFTGLNSAVIYNFTTVDGVFGLFAPDATPLIKYEEIYIRSMQDVVIGSP